MARGPLGPNERGEIPTASVPLADQDIAWAELQAVVGAVVRRTLANRRRAGAPGTPGWGALAHVRGSKLTEAWCAELGEARAGLMELGIDPEPLFGSGAARAPTGADVEAPEAFRHALLTAQQEAEETLAADPASDPLAAPFEAARAGARQKRQGQHLTPAPVADLVLGLAGLPRLRSLLDPTCGTGTFLLRATAWPNLEPGTRLYGSDIDSLAVLLAQLNLARFPSWPVVVARRDALTICPGAPFGNAPLPAPDAVVGNLPYVRLHHLDPQSTAAAMGALAQRWAARDPALVTAGARPRLRLGGHGDLYAILLFHLAEVMPEGTRFALLTSNAWLDDRYGEAVRLLLSRHFRLEAVLESQCERWFPEAAVNTVILVAERRVPRQGDRPPREISRFLGLRVPLLGRTPTGASGTGRTVDPRALALDLLDPEEAGSFRRTLVPADLLCAPAGQGTTGTGAMAWSRFLRATPIYEALASAPGLLPAGAWLEVRRGVTTNCNPFFYPEGEEASAIEPEYLLPVLRSPRQGGRRLLVEIASLASRLFHCERTEAELRTLGHRGALAWISRGRTMKTRRDLPLPEALAGRPWYALRPALHQVVFTKAIHDTHRHPLLSTPAALDQRLYGVACSAQEASPELLAAALNSSLTALSAEVVGSTSLGEGALDLPVRRVTSALLVPDARRLDPRGRAAVLEAFGALARRSALPAQREVQQADRRALDAAWLAGLCLPAGWLPAIHEALVERVSLRLTRARTIRGP